MNPNTLSIGRISARQQAYIVAGLGGLGLAIAGIVNLSTMGHPGAASTAVASESGLFRPSRDQWQTLTVETVQLRDFDRVQIADGDIEVDADKTTQVISPFTGRVVEVFADAGQHVDRRTPLFSVAANEVVQGRADLANALGALAAGRSQLKLAQDTEARQGELYRSAGGALKDWRQAQSDLIAAESQQRAAEAALGAARSRLAVLGEGEPAIAALEHTPASRAVDARTVVYAPAQGVVTRRALGPGQTIAAGGDALFSISDLSTVWLTAQVPESDAAHVRLGADVSVTTPAYPGRTFAAKVVYVAPALDPDTHRLPVRAEIANADGALKPQMFARFRIDSGLAARSPGVPQSAVIRDGDTARVWVATADGALRIRPVVAGMVQDGVVQILQGLAPGEKVVTKGALFVDQAGQPD